ncbi:MAG: sigma-70 family RNA polymerase sigma factor [Bacteroidales bacterium]|jgi:RNA polymerase sigma factor (sigma-70 family)|nr:sigma-70 family RNA polymerase sigma factor [Bacteroidales bacterium]
MKYFESELWDRFCKGDKEAFRCMYELYADRLYRYACKFSPDREKAADSLHDLFTTLFADRKTLYRPDNLLPYLMRVLRNRILRSEKKYLYDSIDDYSFLLEPASEEPAYDEQDFMKYKRHCVRNAIRQLSSRQKEIIYLRYFNEFSNEEAAQIMGISYQSACNTLYRAIESLRKKIPNWLGIRNL